MQVHGLRRDLRATDVAQAVEARQGTRHDEGGRHRAALRPPSGTRVPAELLFN